MNCFSQNDSIIGKVEIDSLKYYQIQKLQEETKKLRIENSSDKFVKDLPSYIAIITALGAVFGVFISYGKYLREKHNETAQKKQENQIRIETRFYTIIENLASTNELLKASAIVSLRTYLKPEYKEFHKQVYLILLAHLKADFSDNANTLMVKTFEEALHAYLKLVEATGRNDDNKTELDLTRVNLYRIDLHGLNLENVDIAFSKLQNANLEGCNLKRAKGYKTDLSGARLSRAHLEEGRFKYAIFEKAKFHGTNLVSAKFKNTNLNGAEFQQALLQEAHLDNSDIYGAKFESANLNNTYLRNIGYDELALKSILKSKGKSWKKANFDHVTYEKLQQLSS